MAKISEPTTTDINRLVKLVKEATEVSMQDLQGISWNKLRLQARKFLKAYKDLDRNASFYTKEFLAQIVNNPDNSSYIKGLRGSQSAYLLRTKYLLAFNFDKAVNAFLEELPKEALYIYDNQGKLETYSMPMTDLAKFATATGRLNVSRNQLTRDGKTAMENAENLFPQEHVMKAQAAYQGTNARLGEYYKKRGLSGSQAQGGLLMWKISREWNVARVTNRGDLKEAYASFLLTEHQSKMDHLVSHQTGSPRYYDDEMIEDFFHQYIYNVTNKPAIVEEDIITSVMQYGVKSAGAEMPSLDQYLKVAEWVSSRSSAFTKEELKTYLNKTFNQDAHRNILIENINSLAKEEIEAVLSIQSKH